MEKREITCIGCPNGCVVLVEREQGREPVVSGNLCPTGKNYALQECLAPRRMITTLMIPLGQATAPIPVKTLQPVPKEKISQCLAEIHATHPALPVKMGQVLLEDVAGTGVKVIATADCP